MTIKTTLDDELKRWPTDSQGLTEAVEKSQNSLKHLRRAVEKEDSTLNTTRLGRQLQRHGRYLRLVGSFEEALVAKEEAIAIWKEYDRHRAHFLCRIQRALIYFHADEAEEALTQLESLLNALDETTKVYTDMIDEAIGRCHHQLGDRRRAVKHLKRALDVRKKRGNARHIAETKFMLSVAGGLRGLR